MRQQTMKTMKNLFMTLLLITAFTFTSCKDDCTQPVQLEKICGDATQSSSRTSGEKLTVCHNGVTLEVSENAYQSEGHGQPHIDHSTGISTPCSDGACGTLGYDDYKYCGTPIVDWEIPCGYTDETIFIDGSFYFIHYPN